jgi:hypothetical protein
MQIWRDLSAGEYNSFVIILNPWFCLCYNILGNTNSILNILDQERPIFFFDFDVSYRRRFDYCRARVVNSPLQLEINGRYVLIRCDHVELEMIEMLFSGAADTSGRSNSA